MGKVTSTRSPPAGCGRAVMLALWASAMAWTMDSPRPRPSPRLVRFAASRWKGWKSRSSTAAGDRGPGIEYRQDGAGVPHPGADIDPAAGHVVAQRVVHQVRGQL